MGAINLARADRKFAPAQRLVGRELRDHDVFPRPLALLDQLPKLAVLPELIVFRHRQFAAEKEVPKRVFVQDAMDA